MADDLALVVDAAGEAEDGFAGGKREGDGRGGIGALPEDGPDADETDDLACLVDAQGAARAAREDRWARSVGALLEGR